MYPITSRRWFFPAILVLCLVLEALVLRTSWRTDIQSDPKLRKLQVRSGYELLLESRASTDAQPILSYNASNRHNHRLVVDIRSARLSDERLRLLSIVNPPKASGRLIYAPDPSDTKSTEQSCLLGLRVEFPPESAKHSRSVAIAPPKADDVFNHSSTRLVHLESHSPLTVRLSANQARERRW